METTITEPLITIVCKISAVDHQLILSNSWQGRFIW